MPLRSLTGSGEFEHAHERVARARLTGALKARFDADLRNFYEVFNVYVGSLGLDYLFFAPSVIVVWDIKDVSRPFVVTPNGRWFYRQGPGVRPGEYVLAGTFQNPLDQIRAHRQQVMSYLSQHASQFLPRQKATAVRFEVFAAVVITAIHPDSDITQLPRYKWFRLLSEHQLPEWLELLSRDPGLGPTLSDDQLRALFKLLGIQEHEPSLSAASPIVSSHPERSTTPQSDGVSRRIQIIGGTELFGSGRDALLPTMDEFSSGAVHRSRIADAVSERVIMNGWALVRGDGKAGKTILATHLALDDKIADNATYFDFVDSAKVLSWVEEVRRLALQPSTSTLLIMDNVHLDERLALGLFRDWETGPMRTRLLMLGRHTSATTLSRLDSLAFKLSVERDDLRGVLLRIARRWPAAASAPADEKLDSWLRDVGGDLVAFAIAVSAAGPRARGGEWSLRQEDAWEHVRQVYLAPLSRQERGDLLLAAACASIELEVPLSALRRSALEQSRRLGHVGRREQPAGTGRAWLTFRPASVGDLILRAEAATDESVLRLLLSVAKVDPPFGLMIVARLFVIGRSADARAVMSALGHGSRLKVAFGTAPIDSVRTVIEYLVAAHSASAETQLHLEDLADQLTERAAWEDPLQVARLLRAVRLSDRNLNDAITIGLGGSHLPRLAGTLVRAGPASQVALLRYAQEAAPKLLERLLGAMKDESNMRLLGRVALSVTISDANTYLAFLRRLDADLFRQVSDEIGGLAASDEFLAAASRSTLDALAHFVMRLGHDPLSHQAYAEILAALRTPESVERLRERAATSPADQMRSFLRFVREDLADFEGPILADVPPQVRTQLDAVSQLPLPQDGHDRERFAALERTLAGGDASAAALADVVSELAPADIVPVLRTLAGLVPMDVMAELDHELAADGRLIRIASRYPEHSLKHLVAVAQLDEELGISLGRHIQERIEEIDLKRTVDAAYDETLNCLSGLAELRIGPSIIKLIEMERWGSVRRTRHREEPNAFRTFQTAMDKLGRVELARAPAERIVMAPSHRQWRGPDLGLHQLGAVLEFGVGAGRLAVASFLDNVVTEAWLEQRYSSALAGGIASSLYRIWRTYGEFARGCFATEGLKLRLDACAIQLIALSEEPQLGALRLLGVGNLYGLVPRESAGIPRPDDLTAALVQDELPLRQLLQALAGIHVLSHVTRRGIALDSAARLAKRLGSVTVTDARERQVTGILSSWLATQNPVAPVAATLAQTIPTGAEPW